MVVIGAIGIGFALILALLATAGVSGIASSAALVPAVGVLGLGATTARHKHCSRCWWGWRFK
ncbi:hypothetical protein [Campylobacter gastrosuis]|uniref:Uncharacterized protein n=1 Tax=Campylobacter gastrosuis TaxID=2974576 RepID=A0ABT7HRI5_9BACT|nr:hypothetical protein [Campylobacter gastrosuis]MDL0089527.1 hypothetical protein [Campylobacter gastrosuis]